MSSNLITNLKPSQFAKILQEGSKALRELNKIDPRERFVLLYPDSDGVRVGMGLNLLNNRPAEAVYKRAEEILNKEVLRLCLEGPKSELNGSLENRHIAAFVTSHAVMTKLANEYPHVIPRCKAAGGVGVGFINSLVFSGALSFENGLDLVQRQGQAMDKAAQIIPSARIKVRIAPATRLRKICEAAKEHCIKLGIPEEISVCSLTKRSHPHKIEIAGHVEAIKYLEEEGERLFRFKSLKRLDQRPYAYHTDLMMPAKVFIEGYLKHRLSTDPNYLREPTECSVYSSTSGCRTRTTSSIVKDLEQYPVKPILVEQLLQTLFNRPKKLAQPNIYVLWDKNLLKTLALNNRKAWLSAKLLDA